MCGSTPGRRRHSSLPLQPSCSGRTLPRCRAESAATKSFRPTARYRSKNEDHALPDTQGWPPDSPGALTTPSSMKDIFSKQPTIRGVDPTRRNVRYDDNGLDVREGAYDYHNPRATISNGIYIAPSASNDTAEEDYGNLLNDVARSKHCGTRRVVISMQNIKDVKGCLRYRRPRAAGNKGCRILAGSKGAIGH